MTCPYCGANVAKSGPPYGLVWACTRPKECGAFVGCVPGTDTPLGPLADKRLRDAHARAADAISRLRSAAGMTEAQFQAWLRAALQLQKQNCEIPLFTHQTCKRVVYLCDKKLETANAPVTTGGSS